MKLSIFLLALTFFTTAATATDVCSNVDSMKISERSLTLTLNGKKSTLKLIHLAYDFAISKSGKWTAVYGGYFPKSKKSSDQTFNAVSIFLTKNIYKPKKILILSQGVYEIMFDKNEKDVYVSARYGLIRVDGSTFIRKDLGMNFGEIDTDQYSGRCESVHLKYPK